MRKLYHFLLQIFNKLKAQSAIQFYDAKAPVQQKSESTPLIEKGWHNYSSQELFGESFSALIQDKIRDLAVAYDRFGNWMSRDVPASIVARIVNNPAVQQIVEGYLGPNARMDDVYFWFKSGNPAAWSLSEGWHDDNVGHRLKFFICLGADANAPQTFIVEGTHRPLYRFNIGREFSRIFRQKVADLTPALRSKVRELNYDRDRIMVFDTNLLHRGNYDGRTGSRDCLIVEFIDRDKSNSVSGKAPCGPGQKRSGMVRILADAGGNGTFSELLDKRIFRKVSDSVYSYSIANQ